MRTTQVRNARRLSLPLTQFSHMNRFGPTAGGQRLCSLTSSSFSSSSLQVKETTGLWTQTVRRCLITETSAARGRGRPIMLKRNPPPRLLPPLPHHPTPLHRSPDANSPGNTTAGLAATVLISAASSVTLRTPSCPPLLLMSAPPLSSIRYRSTPPRRHLLLPRCTAPLFHPAPSCPSGTPAAPRLPSTPPCIRLLRRLLFSPLPGRLPNPSPPLWTLTPPRRRSTSICRRVSHRSSRRPSSCSSFIPSLSRSFLGALLTRCPWTLWFSSSDFGGVYSRN